MASRDQVTVLAAAGIAGAALLLFTRGSKPPTVTYMDGAFDQAWSPYSHFLHTSPAPWIRCYPATVAPNCLPMPYQNADVGLSVKRPEVSRDYASTACAQ